MSTKTNAIETAASSSGWGSYKSISGGTTSDIRRSVAEMKSQITQESKIFSGSSILNGGIRTAMRK